MLDAFGFAACALLKKFNCYRGISIRDGRRRSRVYLRGVVDRP